MSYAPPSIGPAGLTIPSYTDILNLLTGNAQSIYGPGEYLGTDSPFYQMISAFALAASDQANALQLAINNATPVTAIGGALSNIVAFNGIARMAASYSTCQVTISGTPGTVIVNGKVRDSVPQQGYLWDLPASVTIGGGGNVSTSVVCEVIGNVQALAGQINLIATPTAGWTSVNNTNPASPGQPVETDSQLRTRQAESVALPSITELAGTIAAIAAVQGVTRQNTLENPTGSALTTWPITVGNPLWYGPPHSITACVEGGTQIDVATAIYDNRGIGCFTNGTTIVPVTDPNSGQQFNVGFYLPTDIPIYVTVNAHALTTGFNASIEALIQTAIVNYLNGIALGGTVSYAAIVATAMSVAGNLEMPIYDLTSLFIGLSASPSGTIDIPMTAPQNVAQGISANVIVNSV